MAGESVEPYPRQETTESLQKILDENVYLIHQLLEFQKETSVSANNPNIAKDRQVYTQKLHQNLIYLATLADNAGSAPPPIAAQHNGNFINAAGALMPPPQSNMPVNGADGGAMLPPHGPVHHPYHLMGYGTQLPAGVPIAHPMNVGYRVANNPSAVSGMQSGIRAYPPYRVPPPQGHMVPHMRHTASPISNANITCGATCMPATEISLPSAVSQRLSPYPTSAPNYPNALYTQQPVGMQPVQPQLTPSAQGTPNNMPPPGMIPNYMSARSGTVGVNSLPGNSMNTVSVSPTSSVMTGTIAATTDSSSSAMKVDQSISSNYHQMNPGVSIE